MNKKFSLESYQNDLIKRLIGSGKKEDIENFKNDDTLFEKYRNERLESDEENYNTVRRVKDEYKGIKKIKVYVKTNSRGYITDINSDIFIKDFNDWKKIDEGYGDRFAHAQSEYFGNSLINENGNYRYKLPNSFI